MIRPRAARWLVGAAVLAAAHLLLRGYVTDDTYIHLRYAENFVERGEFSFNPGASTYGATSPLWIFGLALLLKLGLSGEAAAWTLGLIAGALAVALWAELLGRLPWPSRWRRALFLVGIADAWFLRWTMSGMETPLAAAALLLLLWPLVCPFRPRPPGSTPSAMLARRYLGWGVAAGLAALVRPEFLLLGPLALPWLLMFEYRRGEVLGGRSGRYQARPQPLLLAVLTGWLATMGPWLVYARTTFGRFLPGTAAAKSNDVSLDVVDLAGYVGRSVVQLGATQAVVWLFLGVLAVLVITGRRDPEVDSPPEFRDWSLWQAIALVAIPLTWAVAAIGGYALSRVWIISRYLVPLSMPLLLALGLLAFWLAAGTRGLRNRRLVSLLGGGTVALTLALDATLLVTQVRPHARDFSAGVRECYLDLGRRLGRASPPDAVVAALDIGALAYGSDLQVLDLMGLVSPEVMELGRREGFAQMVESGSWLAASGVPPAWLVDRTEGPPRWADRTVRGVRFSLEETCTIHGVGLRETQDWTVALYRLTAPPP